MVTLSGGHGSTPLTAAGDNPARPAGASEADGLCRPANDASLPPPLSSDVVEREGFLKQIAAVAEAWGTAAARDCRDSWLQLLPDVHEGRNEASGLAALDVNVFSNGETADNTEPLSPADTFLSGDGQVVHEMPVGEISVGESSKPRWKGVADELPQDVRRQWGVAEVGAWLRALGMSDSAVGRAAEKGLDGATLLGSASSEVAESLGLATLGSQKLLDKALKTLTFQADNPRPAAKKRSKRPPRPRGPPDSFTSSRLSADEQRFAAEQELPHQTAVDRWGFVLSHGGYGDLSSVTRGL